MKRPDFWRSETAETLKDLLLIAVGLSAVALILAHGLLLWPLEKMKKWI